MDSACDCFDPQVKIKELEEKLDFLRGLFARIFEECEAYHDNYEYNLDDLIKAIAAARKEIVDHV